MHSGDNKNDIIVIEMDDGSHAEPHIDAEQLRELAFIHCSVADMADIIGCSVDVLKKHYSDAINRARAEGRADLRRRQYAMAMVNPVMSVWLGKQLLGQRDRTDVRVGNPDGSAFNAQPGAVPVTLEAAEQSYLELVHAPASEPDTVN